MATVNTQLGIATSKVSVSIPPHVTKTSLLPFSASRIGAPANRHHLRATISKRSLRSPRASYSSDLDNEWGPEKEDRGGVAVIEKPEDDVDELKKQLVDSLHGTNCGLTATSETRAEIVELITRLEARNPTAAPTESLSLLNGKWILSYTSFVGLFPLLARGTVPFVKVNEVSQTIDSQNFTVQNSVQFSGPLASTSVSTNAKFEVRSPKRVQIKFEEGVIGTPQLTDSIVFPESVEFLGQKVDLLPLKGLLSSLETTASTVAKTISSQPPLKIPISDSRAESWLLTTYLDGDLRVSRGDGGSVFVLIKEGSPLFPA